MSVESRAKQASPQCLDEKHSQTRHLWPLKQSNIFISYVSLRPKNHSRHKYCRALTTVIDVDMLAASPRPVSGPQLQHGATLFPVIVTVVFLETCYCVGWRNWLVGGGATRVCWTYERANTPCWCTTSLSNKLILFTSGRETLLQQLHTGTKQ